MSFHWEQSNSFFTPDPDLNYIVYYKGCFCPPHAGHFNQVNILLQYTNVKVIIHQKGGKSRHGVSKEINRQIWKYYIQKLLPKERVNLVQYTSEHANDGLLLIHPWIKSCDVLVILKGDEFEDQEIEEEQVLKRHRPIIKKLFGLGIKTIFYYTKRNHDIMSASTFISRLIQYKKDKKDIDQLYQYLPELTIRQKGKVIKLLLSCPLIV